MAVPDLTHVTTALTQAQASVAKARASAPAAAQPHLDDVEAQLKTAAAHLAEVQGPNPPTPM